MNKILTEKQYQRHIIDYLKKHNGYIERTDENFDRAHAMDRELLFKFLNDSQPDEMAQLKKIYKNKLEETLIGVINGQITAKKSSLLETLKRGIDLSNIHLSLMYTKPATEYNKELNEKYAKNIFSVAEEVWATDSERIDLVLFLNGFAIISFELKCNTAGQNYENAITQYRLERDSKARLFLFKAGCVVNFAMDLEECYMTTKLNGASTFFLPFNKGNGTGIDAGKGNPINPNDIAAVSYVWEDMLQKDHLIEILTKFTFVERKVDDKTKKLKENIIFPRYHQLDCIRKILDDVTNNKTSQNYLIQHSAGSGKTYTIAWLAHRLTSLHDTENKQIYDTVVIVTDRVVVDRQLQDAVRALEHKTGLIKVMDKDCSSGDLKTALEGNTKIIVTTIQKFLYIADLVKGLKNKTFAVIIDEAHSSTSGKDMVAVTTTLASDDDDGDDAETMIANTIKKQGKQKNVSMFAFTATPKPTTLALFGRQSGNGYEAFHLYSMKQAIEEGFIIDVLQSFTPYETLFKINKKIAEDPKFKTAKAKKKIARFAMLHPTNIAQRIEIIVEHFKNIVLSEQPWAKAMVVTSSRVEAVQYYNAFQDYVKDKGYTDVHPLIAFSGKVTEKQLGISNDTDKFVTESSINGFSEEATAKRFDEGDYQVLLVANKYQTGFDQNKLCAMYVLKKLRDIAAVQTLSRLNRICPPYNKKVFILDFANKIEDIEKSFKPYFTSTILCNTVTPESVYELDEKIDSYNIFTLDDAIEANDIFYSSEVKDKQKEIKIINLLSKSKRAFDAKQDKDKRELYVALRRFVRFYEFLLQVSTDVSDIDLYKKYNFITWLLPYLKTGKSGDGFDLKGMIQASNFEQRKGQEVKVIIAADPKVSLPTAETFNLTEDEERRLSEIIDEVNARTGKHFDKDMAFNAALQVRDILKKDSDLVASAQTNTIDNFSMPFYDHIDDALVKGFTQNQDFFTMLLDNSDIKKEVLGIFMKSIYNELKTKKSKDKKE